MLDILVGTWGIAEQSSTSDGKNEQEIGCHILPVKYRQILTF